MKVFSVEIFSHPNLRSIKKKKKLPQAVTSQQEDKHTSLIIVDLKRVDVFLSS